MHKKWLSSLLSLLLVFSLFLPSIGAVEGEPYLIDSEKNIVSKFENIDIDLQQTQVEHLSDQKMQLGKQQKEVQSLVRAFRATNRSIQIEELDSSAFTGPQNYVPISDSAELISVIVELQAEPVKVFEAKGQINLLRAAPPVVSQLQKVQLEQKAFKEEALKKLNIDIGREYTNIFNGFSMTIPANQVEDLLSLPGVKAIYPDNTVHAASLTAGESVSPMMERSAPYIGSHSFWDAMDYRGAGMKVGIIDTGVARDHPDLANAIPSGYWGYNFVNNDRNPYETTYKDFENAPDGTPSHNDQGRPYWTSHGTHVAGTVAGRGVGVGGHEGITGVAPEATIYAYKVLGPYGSGSTANVIAAIDRAVDDDMDVINLSLGSESNNERSADAVAVNNAMKAGVITVVSNGNSGPDEATVTDPGTAELAISVGATKPPLETPVVIVNNREFFMSPFDNLGGIETLTGQYELIDAGLGTTGEINALDLEGKVAFIRRGDISFGEKSTNAKDAGAVAAIIYNNLPEALESGTLGEVDSPIPTYALSGIDGDQIKEMLAQGSLTITFATKEEADIMGSFSSRGPALPSYAIKPDISAPGVGIVSSVPEYEQWYQANNGTSMAAPHIAGAAALLKGKYPQLNQFEIKALLMNNTVKISDRSNQRYSHMDQGSGRVALNQILEAKAIAMVKETTDAVPNNEITEHYTGSISYGYLDNGQTVTREVTVKAIRSESSSYTISHRWYGEAAGAISTSKGQVNISENGADEFTVTLTVDSGVQHERYEGELILTEQSGSHVIQIPFAVYVGELPQISPVANVSIERNIFSPNGDTTNDTANITFTVNHALEYFSLEVFTNESEPSWVGTIIEAGNGIGPGNYIIRDWDGTYLDPDFSTESDLEDGYYLLVPWVGDGENGAPINEEVAPFIIDRSPPVSTLDNPEIVVDYSSSTGTISGQIGYDLLVDLLVDNGNLEYNDVIGVAVLYRDDVWKQVDGQIDEAGGFTIEVPVKVGKNRYEVYVYDLADNGLLEPAHIIEYELDDFVTLAVHPRIVETSDAITLDVRFNVTDAVYSASFDLLYSKDLGNVSVLPSSELAAHQAANNPEAELEVREGVHEEGEGIKHEYSISLNDIPGYEGSGSFATFTFSDSPIGEYQFNLSNLQLLNEMGEEISVGVNPTALVSVVELERLEVEPEILILEKGESEALSVKVSYSNGTTGNVTDAALFSVLDPAVAVVDNGIVNALENGSTQILVTYRDLNAMVDVTVTSDSSEPPVVRPPDDGDDSSDEEPEQPTPPETAQKLPEGVAEQVKKALNPDGETVIKLKSGLTLTIPAGAIGVENVYIRVTEATEQAAKELIERLRLGAEIKPFGVYYDIEIVDENDQVIHIDKFNFPVQVKIPVEKLETGDLNKEKLSFFKIVNNRNVNLIGGRLVDGEVVVQLDSFSRYMLMAKDKRFTDVNTSSYAWALKEIEVLASKGIILGRPGNSFDPQAPITRAEFTALLARTLGLEYKAGDHPTFHDVQQGSWYYDVIRAASSNCWVNGYHDNSFAPSSHITRAEMAVILSRALQQLGVEDYSTDVLSRFTDQGSIQRWARAGIGLVVDTGVMRGRAEDRFVAQELTTRAEAAVVMYRIFNEVYEK